MNRKELERTWPAAEPSPGFPDRVLDRLQRGPAEASSESARQRASVLRWRSARPLRWLAFPALALALAAAGVLVFESTRSRVEGEVIAAEPRVVSLGARAVAELSGGAHVRWSGDDQQQRVQQEQGEVTYRVQPGGRFEVQTPYGSVAVLGTTFRVVVAEPNPAGAEAMNPRKKRWGIAGAGASLAALLFVSVERGSVRISTAEHALEVGAGQAGSVGSDGVPRLESTLQRHAAGAPAVTEAELERQRNRKVADAVRRHAAKRREAARAVRSAADPAIASPPEPAPPPVVFRPEPQNPPPSRTAEEQRQREYIQRTVREQYFPVARDCYGELLARQPEAGGRVTLEFAIVGDADAGVVDRVALREDETTIDDEEFRLCMTESMYTAVFEPPPAGAGETTVVYPITLAPE
jgi:hypothetical protein